MTREHVGGWQSRINEWEYSGMKAFRVMLKWFQSYSDMEYSMPYYQEKRSNNQNPSLSVYSTVCGVTTNDLYISSTT